MNSEPVLDHIFHVFGYTNTVSASATQHNQMDRVMFAALNDIKLYGRQRTPVRYAMIEDHFIDSVFNLMRDLTGDPPLPPYLADLLEQYDSIHYLSDTAVRFYERHGFEPPGVFIARTTREAIPRQAGTVLTLPVLEPLSRVA